MIKTVLIWAAIVAFGYWYSCGRPNLVDKFFPQLPPVVEVESSEKLRSKKSKGKKPSAPSLVNGNAAVSTPTSSAEGKAHKKRKITSQEISGTDRDQIGGGRHQISPREGDDKLSNQEFAKQLAKAQTGTNMQSVGNTEKNKNTRYLATGEVQARGKRTLEEFPTSDEMSSTTGGDADDDESPAASPPLGSISTAATSKLGDVSDMLEPAVKGPSILKLSSVPEMTKRMQKMKQPEAVESKKQRQNRLKREKQREINQQTEALHKLKGEKQMRLARMADGTSAQTRTDSFKPPTENAWLKNKSQAEESVVKQSPLPSSAEPLLDTFEPSATKHEPHGAVQVKPLSNITNQNTKSMDALKSQVRVEKASVLAASSRENLGVPDSSSQSMSSWAEDLPTEEEQMRRLREDENWSVVPNKKDKKKYGKTETDTGSEASAKVSRANGKTIKVGTAGAKEAQSMNRFLSIEET